MKKLFYLLCCWVFVSVALQSKADTKELACVYDVENLSIKATPVQGDKPAHIVHVSCQIVCNHCAGSSNKTFHGKTLPSITVDTEDQNKGKEQSINEGREYIHLHGRTSLFEECRKTYHCDCVEKECSCVVCSANSRVCADPEKQDFIQNPVMLPDASSDAPICIEGISRIDDIKQKQREYIKTHYEDYNIAGNMYTMVDDRFIQITAIENSQYQGKLILFDMTGIYKKLALENKNTEQEVKELVNKHKPLKNTEK